MFDDKEKFVIPGAGEGFDDGFLGGMATGVTKLSEFEWVTLAGDDSAEDFEAGLSGDVGEDVV